MTPEKILQIAEENDVHQLNHPAADKFCLQFAQAVLDSEQSELKDLCSHETNPVECLVMPDHDYIWLIPDGDGGASWCDDPEPSNDLNEAESIKYKRVEYIVELEDGVWLADLAGDPRRTCRIKNAKTYMTRRLAEYGLAEAQKVRGFAGAVINEA